MTALMLSGTSSTGFIDRLVLGAGIAQADVTVSRGTTDLDDITLAFAGGGSIFLDEQFLTAKTGIDFIEFADGMSWSRTDLRTIVLAAQSIDGNDVISGFYTDDVISGGLGDDTINGLDGADVLTGGSGSDALRGGDHSDTYLYSIGDGDDVLYDYGSSTGFIDRLVLGAGIAQADVTVSRGTTDLDDITLAFAGGGSIFLDEQFLTAKTGIDLVEFADGASWDRATLLDFAM